MVRTEAFAVHIENITNVQMLSSKEEIAHSKVQDLDS
jgi:hypothetical protein